MHLHMLNRMPEPVVRNAKDTFRHIRQQEVLSEAANARFSEAENWKCDKCSNECPKWLFPFGYPLEPLQKRVSFNESTQTRERGSEQARC